MRLSPAGRKRPVALRQTRRLASQRSSRGRRREGARSPSTTRLPRQGLQGRLEGACPPAWVPLPRPIPQVGTFPRPLSGGTESDTETRTRQDPKRTGLGPRDPVRGLVHQAAAARRRAHSRPAFRAAPGSPTDLVRRGPRLGAPGTHPAAQQQPQPQKRRDELPRCTAHVSRTAALGRPGAPH